MSTILNPGYAAPNVYRGGDDLDTGYDESQMYVEASTMTQEDETIMKQFASEATKYAQSFRKKKKEYDWHTKNTSFLETYNDLYKLGIKNNRFFLRIYDTGLIGVDPYSPVLPKEMQIRIFIECLINPYYWLREILRIPEDGKPIEVGGGTRYRIDRNNVAGWYLFLHGVDHYRSKPRQQGKTQDCVAQFNYAYHFGNMASTMLFFNKDQDQANINLYRLKCQRDMMPTWLQMRAVINDQGKFDKGIDNTKSIRNPVNGNTIMTMGKATSKESAMKLGRGATAALQYYDEFDFIPYQTEIMNAASFAYSTAAKNAAENKALYGRILSSTPGDLDMRDGAAASEYVNRMLKWDDHMLDMDIKELKKIATSKSYNRFVFVEHSWKQLKLSNEWYEQQCGLVSFNVEVIMREIELKRIHGSSQSPFKRKDLIYLMNHVRTPINQIDYSNNLCPIYIYEKLRLNKVYMLCVDPSEGLAQDNNAMTLIDPVTRKPVAEFQSPYISQPAFCTLLCRFLDDYCPRSVIIIESNKGRELINRFLETKYRFQLYYDDGKLGDQVIEKTDPYGRLKAEATRRRAFGVWTGSNRSQYFGILENIMEESKDLLLTKYLVEDTCGLIRKPNGRVEAGQGAHDDNIMSYLIGMFVFTQAPYEKLEEFGIHRGAGNGFYEETGEYAQEDYDENGQITQEGSLRQMANLLPSLPPNMQEIVKAALAQQDPVKESQKFYKEVERARAMYGQDTPMGWEDETQGDEDYIPTEAPLDLAHWAEFDRGILKSNEPQDDPFGISGGFDVEDYLD